MYIVAHCLVFFLPGFLVCAGLGARRQILTLSFLFSYCWITALTLVALQVGLSFEQFAGIWLATLVILTLLAWLAEARWQRRFGDSWIASVFAVPVIWFLGLVLIAAAVAAWLFTVGAYTETPSDALNHLGYVQGAIADLGEDGRFTSGYRIGVIENPPTVSWYYVMACLAKLSGVSFDSVVLQASIANVITLLLVVFGFGAAVFDRVPGPRATVLLALIATGLFAIQAGVNVFAYIRYYAFAPGFLLLGLYFSTVACVLRFSDTRGLPLFWCALIGVSIAIATQVHMQEAVFIAVSFALVAIYLTMEQRFSWFGSILPQHEQVHITGSRLRAVTTAWSISWHVLAGLLAIGFIVVFVWSHQNLPRSVVFDDRVLSIQKYLPTTRDGYFLNPSWQFYRVIGAWGVVVYVAFLLSWTRMREHPFIVTGMLSPLVTVFNPFFVDLFLRHSYAQNLWRFSLLVPIAFAGSLLVVHALRDLKGASLFKQLASCLLLGLVVATLSVDKIGSLPTWVRWQTLSPTDPAHSARHIADLIAELNELGERTRVVTDPVTGYTITAMTPAYNVRKKFFRPQPRELTESYFLSDEQNNLSQQLLVVNQRTASPSLTGKMSGHWPEEITQTSAYYSPEFLEFVKTHPLDLLWQQDGIALYRIK